MQARAKAEARLEQIKANRAMFEPPPKTPWETLNAVMDSELDRFEDRLQVAIDNYFTG